MTFADHKRDETAKARQVFLKGKQSVYATRAGWSRDLCKMPLDAPVSIKTRKGHAYVARHEGFGYFLEIGVRTEKYHPRANHKAAVFISEILAWQAYEEPADDDSVDEDPAQE